MDPETRFIPLALQSWIVRDRTGPQDERGCKVVHDFEEVVQDLEGDVWKLEMGYYVKVMKRSASGEESGWETDYETLDPVLDIQSQQQY